MHISIKLLLIVFLLPSLLTCSSSPKETSSQMLQELHPKSFLPIELDSLYQPLYRDSFILQENHNEFRHPVEQLFPMKQRLAHNTWILEYTWRIKADSIITVWYIRETDSLRVLDRFSYSEHDEF